MVNEHSFILIRQMAALVRRALVEVCTVPVLLVFFLLVMETYVNLHTRRSIVLR